MRLRSGNVLTLLVAVTVIAARPALAQETFAQLQLAEGIAVDRAGNVFVHWDFSWYMVLTKLAPDGRPMGHARLGGLNVSDFGGSRLATDPVTGNILLLTQRGLIFRVSPDGVLTPFVDLGRLQGHVFQDVFDVLRQQYVSWPLAQPSYGDIAIAYTAEQVMDLFITGTSVGFPFVVKVRVDLRRGGWEAQVIMTNTGTTAGNVNQPAGIAVNAEGWGLVTMPYNTRVGFASGLVRFHATFRENQQNPALAPTFIMEGFASTGMTTDAAGNFYIVSGPVGVAACGVQGSGALVVIPRTIDQFGCETFDRVLVNTRDVAVSPVDGSVYITVMAFNGGVVRFPGLGRAAAGQSSPLRGLAERTR